MIESRVARLVTVFLSTPTRLGDQSDVTKLRPIAKLAREIIAIDARKTDIDQCKFRKELLHRADRTGGIIGDAYLVSHSFEQTLKAQHLVFAVIDDHNSSRDGRRTDFYGSRPFGFVWLERYRERKSHDEFAAFAESVAFSLDLAAM